MKEAGLRSLWPRWPVTLAAGGVIVAGGAAAVAKWPNAWWWLIVVIVVAAAVMPPALAALSQASQRQREIEGAARTGMQGTASRDGGKLPTAEAADLEARVHQTVLSIPYIRRDEEATIRAHLRARRPVLIIGSSMVGKTKMAARIIAEEFSSWPVAIPDSKTSLADLDAKDVALQNSVIWLDDIERLIGAGGITDGALRRLIATGNIVVGTIRARAYDGFRPSDQLRLAEWDVLSVFEHVFISRDLTQKEQERLANTVEDPDIRDRIRTVGLGEYVGAAGQVAEALKLGAAGTDPLGYALVLGAADWRRCGMTRPVPTSLLVPLAEPHLDDRGRAHLAGQDTFSTGLAWATRDINPNVALLQPGGTDSYIVYDYALDLISAQDTPIPDSNWAMIITNADTPELMALGYTAHHDYQRSEIAAQVWRKLADSGHTDQAPRAAFNLGVLLAQQGDVAGAKEGYQKAIDSGHTDHAPKAAVGLGVLLIDQGDEAGAKEAFQKAIDSGHTEATRVAAAGLGELLAQQGDEAGAKEAFQKAIDSTDTRIASLVAAKLGGLLAQQGDVAGAKEAFQKAIDSGNAEVAARAAASLGVLLVEQGDMADAKEAFQKAIDSGDAEITPMAAVVLGWLLEKQGDVAGAKEAFQKAIDSGHTDIARIATTRLGQLLAGHGDMPGG